MRRNELIMIITTIIVFISGIFAKGFILANIVHKLTALIWVISVAYHIIKMKRVYQNVQ